MSTLMKSVSGIRGIIGDSLTPELILRTGTAFARFTKKGTVVVGRDSRPTGGTVAMGIISALSMAGCDVIDIGIVPTPTVQLAVEEMKADGGIVISASHNPIEWNAFKLINRSGSFLNAREIKKLFQYMDEDYKYPRWNAVGKVSYDTTAADNHVKKSLKLVNATKIKKMKYRVALDSVNGAGSVITQELLKGLGCMTIPVHCEMNGLFPRVAEPLPENLGDLSAAVKKKKADMGFAQDPDADRLAIVDETGRPIGEENTIALVAEHLLSKKKGRVVVNLSTTKAVEAVAKKYGAPFKRTKVGEINVVEEMRKNGARIGGEGNGGVISPELHLGRDSLVGIAYILEMMTERKKTVSQLVDELPQFFMKKGKIKLAEKSDSEAILSDIENEFKREKKSRIDGLRIDFFRHPDFAEGWVHLRPSNTEPVFRIITEGTSKKQADSIYRYFASRF